MLTQIQGLHHVTSLASSARANNAFYTQVLGLRRVKKTVNFDAPDVYHLYFGTGTGTPGSVMTSFPFPNAARGRRGTGEAGLVSFSVPAGSLDDWAARLARAGVTEVTRDAPFGDPRLLFEGPDGESLALVETPDDPRAPWAQDDIPGDMGIRGFHSVHLRVTDAIPTLDRLAFMGYVVEGREGPVTRLRLPSGNGADRIDVEASALPPAVQSAGSVHHIAFSVADRTAQAAVRDALIQAGERVTPQIDRDYFEAIYFRTEGGILFEVATDPPGFTRDEDATTLGRDLKLPAQHAHLRARLEASLEPLPD